MIIPAIDLIDGQVVRLYKGDYGQETIYDSNPINLAQNYEASGAEFLHLVDLTGAKNEKNKQTALIENIVNSTQIPVQVGGGIRTEEDVRTLLDLGVNRVVIGSLAIKDPQTVTGWFSKYGAEQFVLALDVSIDSLGTKNIVIHGWQETSALTLENAIELYLPYGLKHVLCTDISRDGTLSGSNLALYRELSQKYTTLQVQSSGGVSSLADILALKQTGVTSAIIGKALLENKFNLKDAISCW